MELQGKTPRESYTELVHIVNSGHLNGYGRLFGGTLVSWIDSVAGIVGRRYARSNITTVAIDNLQFLQPARPNELVVLCGQVTGVGRTSMEIRVRTYIEDKMGDRRLINTAFVVMVALDENEKPTAVPPLIPETEEDRLEMLAAEKRRTLRKQQAAGQY